MKTHWAMLSCFFFYLVNAGTVALADNHTPEQNKAVKEFAFEGGAIGATYPELKAKFPDLEFDQFNSNPKITLAVWDDFSPKTAEYVSFHLLDGKVYEILIKYSASTVEKSSDSHPIYERLVSKFGKEDESITNSDKYLPCCVWRFHDADRFVSYFVDRTNSTGIVSVSILNSDERISGKKKATEKTDVGF